MRYVFGFGFAFALGLMLSVGCGEGFQCSYDEQCEDEDPCTFDQCKGGSCRHQLIECDFWVPPPYDTSCARFMEFVDCNPEAADGQICGPITFLNEGGVCTPDDSICLGVCHCHGGVCG